MKSITLVRKSFVSLHNENVIKSFKILQVKTVYGSKSPGHDYISNDILKHVVDTILTPLTHIINLSFLNGVFPSVNDIHKSSVKSKFISFADDTMVFFQNI